MSDKTLRVFATFGGLFITVFILGTIAAAWPH